MGMGARFILAVTVAFIALGSGSLMWPRLTDRPRPFLLQYIHDVVLRTPTGQQAANVLGVSDEANVERINLGQVAAGVVVSAKTAVQNRIRTIVVGNAVNQLNRQFDHLSDDQKIVVRQAICEPPMQAEPTE